MGQASDLFTKLDQALDNVGTKSNAVIAAQKVLDKASADYIEAVKEAQDLRNQITSVVDGILPKQDSRVRVSE